MEGMKAFLPALLGAFLAFPFPSLSQGDAARIARVEALLKERPRDAALHYYLARFQCEARNVPAASAALEKVEEFGDGFLPTRDGFENCWQDAKFREVRARMEARLPRLDYAPTAFELEDRTLLPEGIAFDPASGAFFVGSTAKGTITRVGFGNALTEVRPHRGTVARFEHLQSFLGHQRAPTVPGELVTQLANEDLQLAVGAMLRTIAV